MHIYAYLCILKGILIMKSIASEIHNYIENQPVYNSHIHHLPDSRQVTMTLRELLANSYVRGCAGDTIPEEMSAVNEWLHRVKYRSYFVCLEKALQNLYGIDSPLDTGSWAIYDAFIRERHQEQDWHIKILKDNCRYMTALQDSHWNPGDDNGHPELFKPVFRINSLLYGYDKNAADHNGHNMQVTYHCKTDDIEEYKAFAGNLIREKVRSGCIGLKSAAAYDRTIAVEPATREAAQKALRYMGTNGSDLDILHFQNYMFDYICDLAEMLKLPLQIHTGVALKGSHAMLLQSLIQRHPGTDFVVMHGSYPWVSDIMALSYGCPNVYVDLCWLPLISVTRAQSVLGELMEVCNADKIIWGCDTWTSEESYGALLAFRKVLAETLADKVERGWTDMEGAYQFSRMVLHENAAKLYERKK